MENGHTIKAGNYIKYAIIVLIIVFIVLGIFLVQQYHAVRKAQILDDIHRGVPLTASAVTIVRPWMTFDYINKIFALPPDYLKNDLSIADPHYPHTSLSSYAKYNKSNTTLLVTQVEGALYTYLTNNTK